MSEWKTIDSAPKDGTRVKLLCPGGEDSGFYDDYSKHSHSMELKGEWSADKGYGEPTHWMPEPPTTTGKEGGE